ncbi:TetR family transcriptional regulator [Sphaerisporangium sp. NPDC051011]|uniref:TetR/AcrR family transcriptional regulator n=1 Tax=Sphaerisporangium sp. NPDC051011 TaxID=3155792 RepID=UPI0033FE4335
MSDKRSRTRPGYGEGRVALLAAAIEVVGEKGLRGLTYREVARVAGVTHGLVAHHFGTRQELIRATLDYAVTLGADTIHFAGREFADFANDLSGLISKTEGLQAFQFELILEARRDSTLSPSAQEMYDSYISLIYDDLARSGISDRPEVARLVMAALDGIVIQQLVYQRTEETDATVGLLRELLARHARPGPDDAGPPSDAVDEH